MGGLQTQKHTEGLFQSTTEGCTTRILAVGHDAYGFHNAFLNVANPDTKKIVIHAFPHDIDLSPLEACNNLESFELSSAPPDEIFQQTGLPMRAYVSRWKAAGATIDLTSLARCRKLREFKISTEVPQISLSFASSCPNLRRVVIEHRGYSEEPNEASLDLGALENCSELKDIDIRAYGPHMQMQPDLQFLRGCAKVRQATLYFGTPNDGKPINFEYISLLTNLQELTASQDPRRRVCPDGKLIDDNLSRPDIRPLRDCHRLRSLTLTFSGNAHTPLVDQIDLSCLAEMPELLHLKIAGVACVPDFSPVSACKKLRTIELLDSRFSEADLSGLSNCRRLESVTVRDNHGPAKIVLPRLDRHPHMKTISINAFYPRKTDNEKEGESTIDLQPLAGCTSLKELNLRGNRTLTRLDLSPLRGLSNLELLDISANRIEYDHWNLQHLSNCRSLKRLFIENPPRRLTCNEGQWTYIVGSLDITPLFGIATLESLVVTALTRDQDYSPEFSRETRTDPNGYAAENIYYRGVALQALSRDKSVVGELYPKLVADSSRVRRPRKAPPWLRHYRVEWF